MRQVFARARVRVYDCLDALGSRLRHGMPVPSPGPRELHPGPLLLAVLLLVGLATAALKARGPAELFAFACLAVLLVHVDFRSRLLLPVFVIALDGRARARSLAPLHDPRPSRGGDPGDVRRGDAARLLAALGVGPHS
jgi:hypothetical protein